MKKNLLIVLILALAFSFISCTTVKEVENVVENKIVSSDTSVPTWFYNTPVSQDVFYATGTAQAKNRQTAIKRAEMEARNQISEWIETNVKEVLKNYVSDAGEGDNRQNLDAFEQISLQVSETSLHGVTREKLEFGDDDYVYVLMSIPRENIERAFEPASQVVAEKFHNNEAADVANAKMKAAFEDLLNGKY